MSEQGAAAVRVVRPADGAMLLNVLEQLGDEMGARPPSEQPGAMPDWLPVSMPSEEDEALLASLREGFARLSDPQGRKADEGERVVWAVLDGAHQMARTELLAGSCEELRRLLPSLVYLIRLVVAGEAEAQLVAKRAEELLAGRG